MRHAFVGTASVSHCNRDVASVRLGSLDTLLLCCRCPNPNPICIPSLSGCEAISALTSEITPFEARGSFPLIAAH